MTDEEKWKKGRGETIRALRKAKGLSQQELADILGVSKNSVSKYEKGGGYDFEVAEKMAKCFGLQTETLWMPKKLQDDKPEVDEGALSKIAHPPSENPKGIAYYNFEASAGPIEMFQDDKEVAERIFIPGFNDCDMAINVWGDSMYPHYVAGDIILAKQIHDKSIILYGEAYLIITKELRVLKIIKKHEDPSMVILRSANDNYDDVDLERDKILNLYLVKGKVKRNAI